MALRDAMGLGQERIVGVSWGGEVLKCFYNPVGSAPNYYMAQFVWTDRKGAAVTGPGVEVFADKKIVGRDSATELDLSNISTANVSHRPVVAGGLPSEFAPIYSITTGALISHLSWPANGAGFYERYISLTEDVRSIGVYRLARSEYGVPQAYFQTSVGWTDGDAPAAVTVSLSDAGSSGEGDTVLTLKFGWDPNSRLTTFPYYPDYLEEFSQTFDGDATDGYAEAHAAFSSLASSINATSNLVSAKVLPVTFVPGPDFRGSCVQLAYKTAGMPHQLREVSYDGATRYGFGVNQPPVDTVASLFNGWINGELCDLVGVE